MNASILSALGEWATAKRDELKSAPPSIMTSSQRDLWASIIARVPQTHRPEARTHFGALVSAARDGHEVLDVIERLQAYADAFAGGARPAPADFSDGESPLDVAADSTLTPNAATAIAAVASAYQAEMAAHGEKLTTAEAVAHVTVRWPDERGFSPEIAERVQGARMRRHMAEMSGLGLHVDAPEALRFVERVEAQAERIRRETKNHQLTPHEAWGMAVQRSR